MPLFPEDMLETSGDNLPDMPNLPDVYTGVYQKPQIPSYFQPGGPGPGATEKALSYDDLVRGMSNPAYGLQTPQSQVTPQQLFSNPRYSHYDENTNWEDIYGQNQSGWEQSVNGVLKGLNLAATTVAGGFGMLYGLAKSPFSGRLADIWDNPIMRELDEWNKKVDNELLPNYYTNAERNAAWYSTDNWFTTNFLFDKLVKNAGFAVGAMISGNIANAGLRAVGTALAGGAARAAVAAEASQSFRAFTPLLKNTARAFSSGKNIEAAAILEKEISSIADLTAKTSKLAEINAQTARFAAMNDNFRRTVIAAYSSAGEASFEALQTASEYRDNLIAKYRQQHGDDPTGEALDQINKESESVGKTSFFGNMALLSITEFSQLPFLAGSSYKNTRAAANSLINRADDILMRDGKYVASQPTSRFGKIYEKVTGVGRYVFDPKEALQEVGQYALQVGTQNYFNKAREGKDADAFVDGFLYGFVGKDERGEGKGAFVSKEGMESLVLGGITGGLMQAFGAKGKVAEERALKSSTQKFVEMLNNAPTFKQAFKDRLDAANRGVVLQQQHQDAVVAGDELEARDLQKDILHNYLAPRIKYGRFDMVMSDLADLRTQGSTEEGLASLKEQGIANMNDTVPQYQERISNIEKVATYTNTLYESLDLRYSGVVDKDGNKIYPTYVVDKMAYAASKVADYDVRIPNVNSKLADAGIDTSKVLTEVIRDNRPKEESIEEAVAQIDKLDVNSDVKDDLKRDLRDVVELSLRRKMFLEEYDDIKANPQKYNDQVIDEELDIPEEGGKIVKIKTKTGEQDIEIGTEYFLGRVVEYDKNGKEVYRFPKLTVIGENEDGTIKIKDSNGNVKDVTKDVLLDYKLSKVSATLSNKKAKFFMDNANTIFEFNFGKKTVVVNGKKTTVPNKVKGRLEYSGKDGVLNFVYLNKSGDIKRIEVTGDQFVAKAGFDQAMIIPVGQLTAVQKKSLEDYAAEQDARIESKRRARLNILTNLFDDVATKLDETTSLITRKREELAKVNDELAKVEEQIKSGDLTKKNTFKSATNKAIKAANKLSRLREDLRLEIEALEAQKEELEFNLAYVSDMAQNIDELPTDSKEFLAELKEQVSYLEDMTLETGKNINSLSKLMNNVEKALQSAIDYAFNLIERFEKKYPDMPVSPEGLRQFLNKDLEFKGTWPDYQSYLQANPNLMNDLLEFDREIAEIDELDVIPNERTLGELRQEMEGLQNTLSEISQELGAKQLILSRFQEAADRYKQELAEEQKIKNDMALQDQILGTLTSDQQTLEADEKYEADRKKADRVVVSATVSSGGERSNRFGFNFGKFENKEQIRGVYITEDNEKELGLDGFTQRIVDEADPTAPPVDKSEIIALVMVQEDPENSENFWLVDENGKPISDSVDALDEVIYQVMPLEDLEWDDKWSKTPDKKISMFRKSTPKEVVDALKEQYKEWRKNTIKNPSLARHAVEPSFGIPQYVTEKNELGETVRVKDAAVAVEDSGLISEDDLRTRRVVMVPTVEKSIEKGSTLFNDPKGLPFLETETGYVKLQNRPLTKQEVDTIYQAIRRLVDIIYQEGDAQSIEAKRLYNWLKSVVYWGTPKDAPGYNSIWFQRVADEDGVFAEFRLFLSGKGESIPFTPSAIRENESMLKTILSGMYNNVNATMVRGGQKIDWNEPYEEILSISESGEVSSRMWDNYQSFLLSKVDPDGKQRNAKEIPLTTQIKPLTVPGEVNREGIYFMVPEVAQSYTIPEIKAKKASVITPGAPKAAPKKEEGEQKPAAPPKAEPGKYDLTGKKQNTFVSDSGMKILFTANGTKILLEGYQKGITVLRGEDLDASIQKLKSLGKTLEEAQNIIKSNIFKAIYEDLKIFQEEEEEGFAVSGDDEDVADVEFSAEDTAGEDINDEDISLFDKQSKSSPDRTALRLRLKEEIEKFEGEDWNKVIPWLKANFPNVPVYRVKNILQSTNGLQAWGMLQDGAIYIYENAEVGTIYHEVFEAVWKMFTDPKEQRAVLTEFRNRKGSFEERTTGNMVKYSEATAQQAKEQLAEEFRDYVKDGKVPPKPTDGRPFIVKLFSDLVNFIKTFFTGKSARNNTERLFEKIGTGYYKAHSPYHAKLAFAKEGLIDIEDAIVSEDAEFRLKNIRGENIGDIIQHMTFLTIKKLISTNQSLFNVPNLNKTELYEMLKEEVTTAIAQKAGAARESAKMGEITKEQEKRKVAESLALWKSVSSQWDEIISKHEEQLRSYNIEFDENDGIQLRDEDASKKSDWQDATKIDNFKKANGAIKLLLSTIPITRRLSDGTLETVPSSINGVKLLPATEVYMAILNRASNARNIDEMMEIIRQMAIEDANYAALYSRLTKNLDVTKKADLTTSLKDMHDVRLLTAFWKSFKKQNPDVKNVYILDNGDVVVGDSNFTTATNQLRDEYVNSIREVMKNKNPYFEYNAEKRRYVGKRGALASYEGTTEKRVAFLKSLGIEFTVNEINLSLSFSDRKKFGTAVDGIADSIKNAEEIATIGGGNLKIARRLREIAEIQAKLDNPEFNSTYFNVNGERVQTFIGTNAASDLYNELNSISNLSELEGTQYEYLTKDTFAKNSVLLKKMFDLKTGKKIEGAENYLKTAYADGIVNAQTGRNKESSKLSFRDRMVQEINLNLNGYYLNLVPGDASLEWMMYMGNMISEKSITSGLGDTLNVFRGYLIDEINLAKDKSRTVAKDRNKNELRFMKDILGEDLQNKIMKDKRSAEDIVKDPAIKSAVDKAVTKFINDETAKFRQTLEDYRVIRRAVDDEGNLLDGYDLNNIGTDETSNVSNEKVDLLLKRLTINYMINNIELHKLLYSDPYQYSDELKRIKNFLSPRQAIMYGSADFNTVMNKTYNEDYGKKDIGRVNFDRDFFKTATLKDIQAIGKLPGYTPWDEADGGGMIVFQAYRNFRIRSGEWNDREELQYRYDIAYEKVQKGIELSKKEKKIWEAGNPGVMSAYTTLKPIVAGNKADGNSYNDIILDKFALYALSFRVLHQMDPNSNALKLYEKMRREELDYVVFNTARKVGARESYDVYNNEGKFIDDVVYEEVTNVPFSIISVQQEVPSKEDHQVTRGSQMTKLITMDYMEAGVPVDFMEDEKSFNKRLVTWYNLPEEEKLSYNKGKNIYKEIRNNQDLLQEMINVGYQRLLKQFNITENKKGEFEIKPEDMPKVVAVLREEMMKREVNDNISEALTGFESGDVVLEATPAYQQVRNILYSIADREVISPKISGGQKVQIPSSLLESERAQMTEINGKKGYTSDYLQFYEDVDGKRVCEIMVARWFDSNKTDEELLDYFNNTEEGQKQLAGLTGVAFRIPTQKQNSIDAFVIKKFLPKEFGDNVVVPSELVKKMGSDFDIDKLYIYLKNMYVDGKGNIKLVPFYGLGLTEDVRDKFEDLFEEIANAKIEKVELGIEKATKMQRILSDVLTDKMPDERKSKWINILKQIYGEDASAIDIEDAIMTRLQKLGKQKEDLYNLDVQEVLMNDFVETMYKKSIENAYIQSSQNLISHPKNFKRLVSPNSAQQMKDLSAEIVDKLGVTKFDYKAPVNMLSREFMNRLRHAFVSGKYAIGIAAVNQTNHSLNQRSVIIIDPAKLADVSDQDQKWLKDASIRFKKYNKIDIGGKPFATLSMIKNAERSKEFPDGQDISDIIGQFIDGYVDISKGPWIIEFGASPNVAGTWLILIKAGVPIEDVAYFMNQPIIKDLLREVESAGSTWLFNEDLVESLKASPEYAVAKSQVDKVDVIPNKTSLFEMIGNKKLTPEQRAQQHFILDEFLKYSKMSSHLLKVTQGTNFDTAAFNDPFLVFKKMMQLDAAQKSIVSSADKILSNSFIGDLAARINDIRNAFATILKSDSGRMRQVVQTILYPHVNLPDRDFIKLSQKVVADVFDWAVQNDKEINKLIEETLLSNTKSAAKEMNTFVKSVKKDRTHPLYNNQVIKLFNPKFSEKQNGVNNIQIKNKDNKVYDQNQIIFAFDEIKNYLKGQGKMDLYNKLVRASVLQSGLSNSPIAFTSLLPYEDFKEMYNKTLSKLEKNGKFAIEDFVNLNVFERNNWNNDDVVPRRKAQWRKDSKGKFRYNTNMYFGKTNRNIERDIKAGKIPNLLKLSTLAREANYDIMVYSWEVGTKAQKEAMRKAADFSYIKKALFKKVYDDYGDPLLERYVGADGKERFSFVYKAINAWGDGFRANEFYDDGRKSVIDNGFVKVNEVADEAILPYFTPSMETEEGAPQEEAPTELPEIDVPDTRFVSRTSMKLKDGVTYRITAIDSQRLEKVGYTPQEIGKILKAIC